MSELEGLKKDFADLQRRLVEQAGALEQARNEQREALSLAKAVIDQQATALRAPAAVVIHRDRKLPDFGGGSVRGGDESVEEWIAEMKSAFRVMKTPHDDRVELVKQHLKGEAKATVKFMLTEPIDSVEEIFDILIQTYGDKTPIGTRLKEFYERKQMPGETIRSYAYDLQDRLEHVIRREPKRVPDPDVVLKEQLVLGLKEDFLRRELKRKVHEMRSLTFVELLQAAIDWSEEEEMPSDPATLGRPKIRGGVNAAVAMEEKPSSLTMEMLHEEIKRISARQEELYHALQRKGEEAGQRAAAPRRVALRDSEGRYICYNCGEPGHVSKHCLRKVGKETSQAPLEVPNPDVRPSNRNGSKENPSTSIIGTQMAECILAEVDNDLRRSAFGKCRTVSLKIGGIETTCLWDTGSNVTAITESHFRKHFGKQGMLSANWIELTAANGLDIPVLGCLEVEVECVGRTVGRKCIFVLTDTHPHVEKSNGLPGIVGMNVIEELEAIFADNGGYMGMDNLKEGEANIRRLVAKVRKESQRITPDGKMGFVKVAGREPVMIPPMSEMVVEGHCEVTSKVDCPVLVETAQRSGLPKGLVVANILAKATSGRVPVRVMNTSEKVIKLMPRARVATVSKPQEILLKEVVQVVEKEGGLVVKHLDGIEVTQLENEAERLPVPVQANTEGLTESQYQQLVSLLATHQDVFSQNENDYGYTTSVTHCISTGDAPPIKQRHRRVPPQVFQEFKKHVHELVSQGILKESTSPWASPAVIVIKKDGSVRFCCDYRRLNQVTCKDAYPLPRVEEALDALGDAHLFSTLDLTAGYFQVAMNEEDQGKTAVTTPFGLFEWTRMPFGLCNAPATFQRLMGLVLGDLSFDILLVYLDDILVYSRDFESHCERLGLVFQRLRQHGLKLKPSKCFLLRPEVKFLGHLISAQGIKVDMEKVSALNSWPTPRSVKEVRQMGVHTDLGQYLAKSKTGLKGW
ncbi:uncharacterized protein LOC111946903 [Oryzias latipes]|uniref:uncharacterized protein LOC111946903 n=1 Tax=Oryzias latipes TaxID=8090 RepID=UPI000CE1F156|nr:uncharacterized protein LOC111946903 [Oryzias latipes]